MKKILVALSGGVDSSVAAWLLKEQGYDISGAYIRTWMNEEMPLADCPAQQDIEDSRAVAAHLGIDYEIVNLVNEYREHVVNYLVDGYKRGITPNPDMMCNREMKFGIFQDYALKNGFDGIATGHYVRKFTNEDGSQDLLEGLDKNKDQTYFLALLRQAQIQNALFPVGELEKPRVRAIAQEIALPNAAKKDSQGICFLGDMNISRFLEHYIEDKPGDIVNAEGTVLGQHRGLHRYTTGQRRGIGVPSNTDNEFYVVTALDMERNELVVGFDQPETPGLFTSEVEVYGLSFVNRRIEAPRPGSPELSSEATSPELSSEATSPEPSSEATSEELSSEATSPEPSSEATSPELSSEATGDSWPRFSEAGECRLLAKPRYRDPSQAITYEPLGEGRAKVIFDEPQRALSPGQVLALYDGDKLLGGGFYK